SDLVPLQSGTDQLDADLVQNAIFGLLDRLRRNSFVARSSCVDRHLFGNANCHFRFLPVCSISLCRAAVFAGALFPPPQIRFALANAAALLPARRPKTVPFIKPDPPG